MISRGGRALEDETDIANLVVQRHVYDGRRRSAVGGAAQLLREAVLLSLSSAVVGVGPCFGGSFALARLLDWRLVIRPQAVWLAVAFAVGVGVPFGFYRRAALRASIRSRRRALVSSPVTDLPTSGRRA